MEYFHIEKSLNDCAVYSENGIVLHIDYKKLQISEPL